jgi:hypothetical protein
MGKGTTRFQGGSVELGGWAAETIDQNRDGKVDGYFQCMRPEPGQLERAAPQRGGEVKVEEASEEAQEHFDLSARADSERNHRHRQGFEHTKKHTKKREKRQFEGGTNERLSKAKRPTVDGTNELCLQLAAYSKKLVAARRMNDAEIKVNLESWYEELMDLVLASIGHQKYREVEHRLEVAHVCFEAIANRDTEWDSGDGEESEEQAERAGDAQQSAWWLDGPD